MELIVGTYGPRMRQLQLDPTLNVLESNAIEAMNTSCLALSPDRRFLFAVSEMGDDSGVYSFWVLKDRIVRLSEIRGMSPDPCHLLYIPGYYNQCGDPDNGALLTADYSGGTITLFPVQSGRIKPATQLVHFEGHGPVVERQQAPHMHHLVLHGNFLMAVDLGSDSIHVLRLFDSSVRPMCDNRLSRELRLEHIFDISTPAGSGPRHLVIDPSGSHFYVLTELSNDILVYSMPDFTAADDRPVLLQRLPVGDASFPEQAGGDIQLSPDGRHLYASLRNGGDGLVICEVKPDGSLRRVGFQPTGAHVRDFSFLPAEPGSSDKERLIVCCKNGKTVQFYRRNPLDGGLTLTKEIPFDAHFGEPVYGLPLR